MKLTYNEWKENNPSNITPQSLYDLDIYEELEKINRQEYDLYLERLSVMEKSLWLVELDNIKKEYPDSLRPHLTFVGKIDLFGMKDSLTLCGYDAYAMALGKRIIEQLEAEHG